MKKIISALCFALLSTLLFTSCKKETTVKQTEPKDYTSTNMKMNYYGKTLEYTVKYSPSTKKLVVVGKDAKQVQEIVNTHPDALVSVKSETEFTFYNHKNEFYNEEEKERNKSNNTRTSGFTPYFSNVYVQFYKNTNYNTIMRTINITANTPSYNFPLYSPCNAADNWCPTGSYIYRIGEKNPNIGSSQNDQYSSLKTYSTGGPYGSGYEPVRVILHEDANYGGGAIQFELKNTTSYPPTYVIGGIPDLTKYKNNIFLKTWNDRATSYQVYLRDY